jgi:hypothetical protein
MAAVEHFKNDCAGCHGTPNSAHEDETNVILCPNAPQAIVAKLRFMRHSRLSENTSVDARQEKSSRHDLSGSAHGRPACRGDSQSCRTSKLAGKFRSLRMRRTLATMVVLLLFMPDLPARNTNDWANVKQLKHGMFVEILLWTGENLRGRLDEVTDDNLNLDILDRNNPQIGLQHELRRASIHRITGVRYLIFPDQNRWMITGAAAGGAIVDVTHGTNYHWLAGALGGALAGLFVSRVALGAVGVVDAGRSIHRAKIVYSADAPPKSPHATQAVQTAAPSANPPTKSAREELEQLQKQNGLS